MAFSHEPPQVAKTMRFDAARAIIGEASVSAATAAAPRRASRRETDAESSFVVIQSLLRSAYEPGHYRQDRFRAFSSKGHLIPRATKDAKGIDTRTLAWFTIGLKLAQFSFAGKPLDPAKWFGG